ncbi:mucin-2 [Diachasmimorpha longicaudata]|uniref:mucin-2 n=1 Tax=Diachasmimorpha longicaudata TaxID=58733 RepID=UPI0030B8B3B1
MMLLLYFLSLFTLGRCLDPLPSKLEIESSINRTIDEVERLIQSDQSLPRLSRSQIVEILQNITSKDMKNYEESIEQMRSDYQRALMVVLPYNSKDSAGEDLQDLYTKPPMVQVIPDSEIMLPFASIQEEPLPSTRSNINLINPRGQDDSKLATPSHQHKNHRNSYSDFKTTGNPEKFTLNQNNLLKRNNQKAQTAQKSQLEVTYSSHSTERSTTPSEYASSTIPATRSTNILTSDQWRYNAPPSTTSKPRTTAPQRTTVSPTASPTKKPVKTAVKSKPFLPTVISAFPTLGTFAKPTAVKTTAVPEEATFNMADMDMLNDAPPAPLYVTPLSSSPSHGTASTQQQTTPMREEVANLLAAIGLQPSPSKIKTNAAFGGASQGDVLGEDFAIPDTNFIPSKTVGLTSTSPDLPSLGHQNTFDNGQSDLQKGVSNLSPELQSLFQRFGLPVSGKEPGISTTTRKPESEIRYPTTIDSWRAFRPLPTSEIKDEGMRSFLATFGLGEVREQKAMKTTTEAASVIEAVPDNMKSILENIGLITRSRASGGTELPGTTQKPSKLHIFKPHETQIGDEMQKNKINELLDTVKLVQEGKAGVDDVRDAANRLLTTTKTLQGAPDAVSLEEILQMYNQDLRKEVKRQENKDNDDDDLGDVAMSDSDDNEMSASDPSESTMTTNATSPAVTTPSPDPIGDADGDGRVVNSTPATPNSSPADGPSLDDLADSFGGTTAAPDPVLPTPRRSGLYFLVDWNTFLEVGEEDKDKVNLRFSPNAGDRTRFIPVVIP